MEKLQELIIKCTIIASNYTLLILLMNFSLIAKWAK